MEPLNQGIIYTTGECIGCNRCIAACPIIGANVAVIEDGANRIMVDQHKCIMCGHCLETCTHNARAYHDDTESLFKALDSGEPVSLLISPAFLITYGDQAYAILAYLKSRGAVNIYNTGLGADIMVWACLQYIEAHRQEDSFISHQCICVVNYIEKYQTGLIDKLIPIQPPAMCLAIYAREYLHDKNRFAYIGSCIAKKAEFSKYGNDSYIGFNVTFKHLNAYLKNVSLESFSGSSCRDELETGFLFSCDGGVAESLKNYLGTDRLIRQVSGTSKVYKYIKAFEKRMNTGKELPFIVDAMSCSKGCLFGSGCRKDISREDDLYLALHELTQKIISQKPGTLNRSLLPDERRACLYERFSDLDMHSFLRKYTDEKISERTVPEEQIDAIFNTMHKTTEESRRIDCHSCGYHSCRNMATAIALGYTEMDNCVHYVKDENTRLFLTDVFAEIPNTNGYVEYCRRLLKRDNGIGYSAIRFNIKNFTLINKNYGLKMGDLAIKEFSSIIHNMAEEDEIMARISEDNFIGMVRNERLSKIIHDLNNITLHIDTTGGRVEYPVSVHLGVYTLEGYDRVPGDIIRKMATTISVIRRKQDNRVIYFNEGLANDIHKEMSIERMLPEALLNNEFIIYYQPKVRIEDKIMAGAEALIRWQRGDMLISPMEFIPISEVSGFVCKIDFYVLEHVCRKLREWLNIGLEPVKISVNFSKKHFIHSDVAERISAIIDRYGIPHKYIEVEFTETAYIDGFDNLALTLKKLRSLGITTSIDDFGTGYSSLNLLQDLDFAALKLDKSLLGAKCYDEKTKTVIANIIRMAKELNMQIIAEGVETVGEYNLLKQLSCDLIQGYIFDKPLKEEEFVKHIKDKHYTL